MLIFRPVPETHTDMAGLPDFEIERFGCRISRLGKYKIVPGGYMMIEEVQEVKP